MVPHEALHAEKQKVKRYTEEVADFRKQRSETNSAWERRMAQLVEAVKPKQEAAPPPDFFENPALATRHEVQQSVSPQFEQINQQLLAIARDNAETRFTEETVNEAEQAFISAMQSQKLDPADYQKVVSSPNRYAAAVQWLKRQQAKAEIGDDPRRSAPRSKPKSSQSTASLRANCATAAHGSRHALEPRRRPQRGFQKWPGLVRPHGIE
jgi:hypothetical protein